MSRSSLRRNGIIDGPLLLIDAEATAYVPPNWSARANSDGSVILERVKHGL